MTLVYDKQNDRQELPNANWMAVTIGLFFDGTANNSYNVKAREAYVKEYASKKKDYSDKAQAYINYGSGAESSYLNDHTNVNKLFRAYISDKTTIEKFYIEGIGTVFNEKEEKEIDKYDKDDFLDGTGFGRGANGIRGKVYKACENAVSFCTKETRYINFDIFGFSRGAAAARNLVYEITRKDGLNSKMHASIFDGDSIDLFTFGSALYTNPSEDVFPRGFLGYMLKKKGFELNKIKIKIRFVGIFDTVASYDPKSAIVPSFKKYAPYLKMNAMLQQNVGRIVHLTAEDEHRQNFALTPVGKYMNVREISLPGVHTDVGGGYVDDAPENKEIALQYSGQDKLIEREKWLIKQGWFYDYHLSIKDRSYNPLQNNILISNKNRVNAKYSRIPLKIMVDYGDKYAGRDTPMFKKDMVSTLALLKDSNLETLQKIKSMIEQRLESLITHWRKHYKQNSNTDYLTMEKELISEMDVCVRLYTGVPFIDLNPSDDEILFYTRKVILSSIFEEDKEGMIYKTSKEILDRKHVRADVSGVELQFTYIVKAVIKQIMLRLLRARCLHWSATYKGSFWDGNRLIVPHTPAKNDTPTENGKRLIHDA